VCDLFKRHEGTVKSSKNRNLAVAGISWKMISNYKLHCVREYIEFTLVLSHYD